MAPSTKAQHAVNKWGARLIPVLLIGLVGYATWVVISLIAVHYLLTPPNHGTRRTGAAIAVIVLYFLVMLPMSAAYFRTLHIVITNPGYVPQPQKTGDKRRRAQGSRRSRRMDAEKMTIRSDEEVSTPSDHVGFLDRGALYTGRLAPPPGLDNFYARDVFECEIDGLPRWCSACKTWKPDRSHHSSEVGRCVYKLDHYCPWAGGIVSETSFKPFIQFCLYGGLYCVFVLVVVAYFTAEQRRVHDLYNINWIVIIVISGLFSLFTTGMGLNSVHAVVINSTTIDNLTRRTRTHHFCVLLPSPANGNNTAQPATPYPTITYPLTAPDPALDTDSPPQQPRTFAILATPTGSNPYLLPTRLENFKTVMGEHFWDWILPIRQSPCCWHAQNHDRFGRVMYKLGPAIEEVLKDVGLLPRNDGDRHRDRGQGGDRRASTRTRDSQRETWDARPQDPPGSVTMARLEEGWSQTGQA